MTDQISILEELDAIQRSGLEALAAVQDEAQLQAWRTANLGRSAPVMQVFTRLGGVPKEMRPQVGQKANQVKLALEAAETARSATRP